jgi:hypothetical protein
MSIRANADGLSGKAKEAVQHVVTQLYHEQVDNSASWSWKGGYLITAKEVAEHIWPTATEQTLINSVIKYLSREIRSETDGMPEMRRLIPGCNIVPITNHFIKFFYKKRRFPRDDDATEMRLAYNSSGGSGVGIFICPSNHPLYLFYNDAQISITVRMVKDRLREAKRLYHEGSITRSRYNEIIIQIRDEEFSTKEKKPKRKKLRLITETKK